jgi:uncharacterized protein
MTAYAPHQQRVIDEKRELDEKLAKLSSFIDTPGSIFHRDLPDAERQRLYDQRAVMSHYSQILGERIAAF